MIMRRRPSSHTIKTIPHYVCPGCINRQYCIHPPNCPLTLYLHQGKQIWHDSQLCGCQYDPLPPYERTDWHQKVQFILDHPKAIRKKRFQTQTSSFGKRSAQRTKKIMVEVDEKYQLTPPYIHQGNADKQLIQTWKNSSTSKMCSVYPNFPMHLCCQLNQQADVTLYIMRALRTNSKYWNIKP